MLRSHEADRRQAVWQVDTRRAAMLLFGVCLALEVVLVLLDYHVNFGRLIELGAIRRLTNIAREDGLASWFGVTQTAFVAATGWILWLGVRAAGIAGWRRAGWLLVALLFTYMAVDDGAQIHERMGTAYRLSGGPGADLFPSYSWQIVYTPVLGTLVLLAGLFLWRELRSPRSIALVTAALGMFALAVVLDFFEGLDRGHPWNPYAALTEWYDIGTFTRARFQQSPYETLLHFSRAIEEFLEMLANTCIWAALVRHLGEVMPAVRFATGLPADS